jgi:hypothetical protein
MILLETVIVLQKDDDRKMHKLFTNKEKLLGLLKPKTQHLKPLNKQS